jgi:glyoxylase-like metal-dependent hydrolase (beta-lactamase superfamily II)
MVITEPGRITDRITFLGSLNCCVYVVDGGKEAILIGGGMAHVAPDLLRQIDAFGIDERKIKRMVVLHAHFDHCGLIPFLKKHWPWAVVTASARAKGILSDPHISRVIGRFNEEAIEEAGLKEKAEELGFAFTSINVEETVGEGDVISCGDVAFDVLDVPGHSSCSIALYMPQEKALFASDAAGIRYKDYFLAAGNSNYDLYQQSLEKMAGYDVDAVLGEHYGASVGEDARIFLPRTMESARRTRALLEESYRRTGDVEKSTEEIAENLLHEAPGAFFSRDILSLISAQMVKYIARTLEGEKKAG